MSLLTAKEIMEILPHRWPFMLLDTVEELTPGVLIIEALAQAGAVAVLSLPENKGKTAYFAAIQSAKFKRKVIPGDVLMLEVEIIKQKGTIGIGKATATVDGKTAVQAELTFAVSDSE